MGICSKPDKASTIAKKKAGDKKIGDPAKPCPKEEAHIVSIAWLDGGDDKTVAGADQWVNLPREDKWVNNDEIKNKDRLGMRPRLKVKFDKKGSHSFKVKLLPPTGTAAYSTSEKSRNPNFKYTEAEKSFTTDADGSKIIDGDFQLVAGGGFKFTAEAKDQKGKKVTTGTLTTKRLFYYLEAKMTGLTSALSSTTAVESEYAKHHMKLKKLPALSIAHQSNIDANNTDSSTLSTNVTTAVDANAAAKAKKKYLLTIAYTDHLAVKNANVTLSKQPVDVGPGKAKVVIPVTARGLLSPHTVDTRYLWHDIVSGEGWFVEAKFHKDGGGVTTIPAGKVSHKGTGNYWNQVEIDVTGLAAGRGKIEVKVNVVDRMRGGVALGGANQICVCTRSWWSNESESCQKCTVIHEIGHKVGMVANGSGILPDKVATHYSGKGHAGDHCYKGCAAGATNYSTTANLNASQCVIFGSVNEKTAFCSNCEKAVKKLDINSGW